MGDMIFKIISHTIYKIQFLESILSYSPLIHHVPGKILVLYLLSLQTYFNF